MGVADQAREIMALMEEINLLENLDDSYCRAMLATDGPQTLEREIIHNKRVILREIFDMLRVMGGQSTSN